MKNMLELSKERMIGKVPNAVVIADEHWIEMIPEEEREVLPSLQLHAHGKQLDVTSEQLRDAEILILEVDASEPATLERVANLRRKFPQLPIIAAVANADLQLMRTLLRHDVSDAVALPFDMSEVTAEICNIGARLAEPSRDELAPCVAITASLSRSGTTSILLHLADAIVAQSDKPLRACLIDLDVQRGQLAAQAGVESTRSILDLLEAEERLDDDMVRNVATKMRDGLYLIAAPRDIMPIEQVEIEQALRIISLARAQFDLVLIDLPSAWTNWSLSIAAETDCLLLVTEQNLPHLRQARRCLDLFREVGIAADRQGVIVNRAKKGRFVKISVQDVADTLGVEVLATVRDDRGGLSAAIDEGRLLSDISRRNPFVEDVNALANMVDEMIWGHHQ